MKIVLASFASLSLATCGTAFVVQTPSQLATGRESIILGGSRHAQKVASRTKWLESRGVSATAEAETSESGLMTNENGLEFVKLVHPSGASSEIYLYGGVVTSYKDAEGTEFIAVRPDAKTDGSKPISGGLSHCWPQVIILFYFFANYDFASNMPFSLLY